LKLQVETGKTVWVQYDEITLNRHGPESLSRRALPETKASLLFVFDARKPTPEITAAKGRSIGSTKVGADENAVVKDKLPPLWARFYEFETMKPIFIGRDSVINVDVSQIG
jgi:PelA/Pel-15E family pectate lyase